MKKGKLPDSLKELIRAPTGAIRYGYSYGAKDKDFLVLSVNQNFLINDFENHTDYFVWSVKTAKQQWGHPIFQGSITGDCTGNKRLCEFLKKHKKDITYAAPTETVRFGLDYISVGERYGHTSPIKAGLRTAMILSHMAAEAEDPFLLSDEEKAVLIRARTGNLLPDERVGIYRRTLSTENLDKLRRMPENTAVRDELFALLDEIVKEETP